MCSATNRPVLFGLHPATHTAIVFRPDCKTWECPECANKNKRRWTARIALEVRYSLGESKPMFFVTVTCNPKLKTFQATHAVFPNAWGKLYQRLKRQNPKMHYALVPELHLTGRLHFHMFTDAEQETRWYKDNAAQVGLGYMCDRKKIRSPAQAAWYCTEYINKGLGGIELPPNFRRVRVSQNWLKLDEQEPPPGYEWITCRNEEQMWLALGMCITQRLDVTDIETGLAFDFMDMVERNTTHV